MPELIPPTTITVFDLMTLLSEHDPNLKVLVPGYENGWDYLGALESTSVKPNNCTEWWDGDVINDNSGQGELHLVLHRRPKER